MLEGGADIRYIQEMLGHVELSTTQIYTQVSIRRLKALHALTHPSAKIDRPEVLDGENPDASGQCADCDVADEADDAKATVHPALSPEDAKAALFATLATEAESDDAIDDEGCEAGEARDQAGRRPATDQPPTAP